MQLFFIDDSGSVAPPKRLSNQYFVLGGLIIPEEKWHLLENKFSQISKAFKIDGEIKWRFFGQRIGREDKENSLSHLSISERDSLRKSLLSMATKDRSIKIISSIVHLPTAYSSPKIKCPEDIYSLTHKSLTEQFQQYLLELSVEMNSKVNGIMICDHRTPTQDRELRNFHQDLLKSDRFWKRSYSHLVESLFLSPSHLSMGIQLADLISGAMFRYFEQGDNRWYELIVENLGDDQKGFKQVDIPTEVLKENDAGSSYLEPAIMTQSQRTPILLDP